MAEFQSLHLLFGTDGTFFGQEEVVEKKRSRINSTSVQ